MRIHSEAIGTIAVFQNRWYLELYVPEEKDDDFEIFGTGHVELIRAFSKSAPFCDMEPTSNCRYSVVVRLRQIDI